MVDQESIHKRSKIEALPQPPAFRRAVKAFIDQLKGDNLQD